jgi:hypothetical protein
MQRQLFIIGTSHHLQFGAGVSFGGHSCTVEDEAAFSNALRVLADSRGTDAVAEELNDQALREVQRLASVPQLIATELQVPHMFCEPNRAERRGLGIRDENTIRLSVFPKTLDESTVGRLVAESWALREREWLRRLTQLKATRIMLICGADHVKTFVPLARAEGFEVEVVHENWEP